MIKENIATYATSVGGLILIGIGLLGFPFSGLLGLHLGASINLVHLVSGVAALYVGLNARSSASVRLCSLGFGLFYGLLGGAGLALGGAGDPLTILPGAAALRSLDHLFHLLLGAGLLIAGMVQPMTVPTPGQKASA